MREATMSTPAKAQLRRSTARTMPFTPKSFSKAPIAGKNATRKNSTGKEPLAAIAHDTRNVVAALRLYCDLLAEPGVLSEGHQHYAAELQAIAAASSGLVEQLAALRVLSRQVVARRTPPPPLRSRIASAPAADRESPAAHPAQPPGNSAPDQPWSAAPAARNTASQDA